MKSTNPIKLQRFFAFCEKNEVELLAHDKSFLRDLTKYTDSEKLDNSLTRYVQIWKTEMAKTDKDHRSQNIGRYAANTWIRKQLRGK